MDCLDDNSHWDDLDLSTPRLPGYDSPGSGQEVSPLDAGPCSEPESDHAEAAARLPLLRSCDVEPGREYDRENPTCIHYDLKLKVSLRGAGKKRSSQIDLLNKSDVVLAPSELWESELQAHLATLLSSPELFPHESSYTCQGGAVSIKAKTTRSGLDDTFDGDDIPWSKVDQHLASLGLLFRLRRMQITVMVDLTYYESSTTAATGAKRRKTATSKAREKLPSDAVFMTRYYKHHECNGICRNKSMHCLKDKHGNHHPIDWKRLSDMRRAGADKILLYRTREFDKICEQNPKHDAIPLVERVLSWERVYAEHITDLAARAMEEARGSLTGQRWLDKSHVAERLDRMPRNAWNDAKDVWRSSEEEAAFHSISNPTTASTDRIGSMFNICAGAGTGRNKSIYVTLVPQDQTFLSVCSIMTINEGDFLGFFSGYFRYSEDFDKLYGIRGPTEKLWLDYSEATGPLNQMKVAASGGDANVALQWELIEGGGEGPCMWRVAVRALCSIGPFENFVRAAYHPAQYLLHQESTYARTGFTKSVDGHGDALFPEEVRGCA
ncbi:uncharacterized protein BBA_07671 [Beauveria bassiana ARSEF 2860]|uniref:Uncharacterized protein n=1 Tax=Beauveria bassiana (strain ARSEF 2860) TaxID=655819 RepID=J4VYU1_BEAB2|nr:uncharacterized protein BBA_07671 [Beauveria bassiana ARSEF 2860]EJP63495.1 hypothetical protein BBA_07671 [Beauveria bassiana ARSEF 2860]